MRSICSFHVECSELMPQKSRLVFTDFFQSQHRFYRRYEENSVHDFANTFVKPATAGTEMGYALMLNRDDPQWLGC